MGATENEELNEEGLPPPIVVGAITGTDADDNSSALKNAGNDKTGEKFCSRLPYGPIVAWPLGLSLTAFILFSLVAFNCQTFKIGYSQSIYFGYFKSGGTNGACTGYSDAFDPDSPLRIGRVVGVYGMIFGLATVLHLGSLLVIKSPRMVLVVNATTNFAMAFLSGLLMVIGLATESCREENTCRPGPTGALAPIALILYLGAGIFVRRRIIEKPNDEGDSVSDNGGDEEDIAVSAVQATDSVEGATETVGNEDEEGNNQVEATGFTVWWTKTSTKKKLLLISIPIAIILLIIGLKVGLSSPTSSLNSSSLGSNGSGCSYEYKYCYVYECGNEYNYLTNQYEYKCGYEYRYKYVWCGRCP